MTDERIAILENEMKHTNRDLDEFFKFVRDHMDKEEQDRLAMINLLNGLKTKVDRQTYFVLGAASAIAIVWGLVKVLI